MAKFKKDDIVRFKGDDAKYRILEDNGFVGARETYELVPMDDTAWNIDFVPGRLLELIPVPFNDYEIVQDYLDAIYIFYKGKFYEAVHEIFRPEYASEYEEDDMVKPIKVIGRVVLD